MSLRLLIDEDTQAKALVSLLRREGHDVLTAAEAGLNGCDDETVLADAAARGRTLMTGNGSHFWDLHAAGAEHAGIVAVYKDRDPRKSMGTSDVVRALASLEASEQELPGAFVVLNVWR